MLDFIKFIKKSNLGDIKENVSFKDLTTYRTGGVARVVFFPSDVEALVDVLKYLKNKKIDYKILGNGSNILASDDLYNGIVIKLTSLKEMSIDENLVLNVSAGYNFMSLANTLSKQGYTGLEFACGIPGTVGGAIYMNAGAYLKSISDLVISIDILDEDFNFKTITKEELKATYRSTIFSEKNYICLSVKLQLKKGNKEEILEILEERKIRRNTTQPLEYPSAGSVFRNPEGDYAGRLIEELGFKGKTIGGAQISEKHANFIINKANASAKEIKELMDIASNGVKEKFNVTLKREQELFNWK